MRIARGKGKRKKEEKEKDVFEEDHGEDSMGRARFSNHEWDGLSEIKKGPLKRTPKNILKRGATIEYLINQDVVILDDTGLGICDHSIVISERRKVLKDIFIDQG